MNISVARAAKTLSVLKRLMVGGRRAGVSGMKGVGNRGSMGKETGGDCICERARSVKNITILQ